MLNILLCVSVGLITAWIITAWNVLPQPQWIKDLFSKIKDLFSKIMEKFK
jgi:hypothetical protein